MNYDLLFYCQKIRLVLISNALTKVNICSKKPFNWIQAYDEQKWKQNRWQNVDAGLNAAKEEAGLAGRSGRRLVEMLRRRVKENLTIEANCLPEIVVLR